MKLSLLIENGFSVVTQDWCLRNFTSSQVISYCVRSLPSVLIIKEEKPLENREMLLIIDIREQYSCYTECFAPEQGAKCPEHKSWDYQIPLQDLKVKISTVAIYKTTWEEDEALWKYL